MKEFYDKNKSEHPSYDKNYIFLEYYKLYLNCQTSSDQKLESIMLTILRMLNTYPLKSIWKHHSKRFLNALNNYRFFRRRIQGKVHLKDKRMIAFFTNLL